MSFLVGIITGVCFCLFFELAIIISFYFFRMKNWTIVFPEEEI